MCSCHCICGMLSLLDMFNDYFVTDKFFKTNGRICSLEKKRCLPFVIIDMIITSNNLYWACFQHSYSPFIFDQPLATCNNISSCDHGYKIGKKRSKTFVSQCPMGKLKFLLKLVLTYVYLSCQHYMH